MAKVTVTVSEAFESLNSAHGKITSYVGKRDAEKVKSEVSEFKKTLQKDGKWIKAEDQVKFRRFQSAVLMSIRRRDKPKAEKTEAGNNPKAKSNPEPEQETEQEASAGKTDAKQYTHNMVSALKLIYKLQPDEILALVKAELKIG